MIRVLYVTINPITGERSTRVSNVEASREKIEAFIGAPVVNNSMGIRASVALTRRQVFEYSKIKKSLKKAGFDTSKEVRVAFVGWGTCQYSDNRKFNDISGSVFGNSKLRGNCVIYQGFEISGIKVWNT